MSNTETKILSDNPQTAIKEMIKFAQLSLEAIEKENNALAMNNALDFYEESADKLKINHQYQLAAQEMMARAEEFKSLNSPLLSDLKTLQTQLKSAAESNMAMLEPLKVKRKA